MSYPGGKAGAGVYQTIINQMPPHEVYIEPFLGGGAIMLSKRPAPSSIGIDADAAALDAFPRGRVPALVLHRDDAMAWLARRAWTGRELVYCDPPYILSSRRSKRPIYRYEMGDLHHAELLATLRRLPCPVLISGYPSPLYERELRGWRLLTFPATTRGGAAVECLWCNFPAPPALHDYRYLGADYRERERIKKKARRWAANFAALAPLERQAVLGSLIAAGEGERSSTAGHGAPPAAAM